MSEQGPVGTAKDTGGAGSVGRAAGDRARQAGRAAGRAAGGDGGGEAPSRAVEILGRVGLVGYGVVHLLVGALAVQVALSGSGQADQQGALGTIASHPLGVVAIVVVVAGLLAFALWQGLAAATGFRWAGDERTRKRVAAGGKAVGVLGVAAVGVRILVTGASGSSASGPQEASAGLLALPAGQALVGVAGLVVIGIAGATVWSGVQKRFSEDLDYTSLPQAARRPVERLGVVGHVARGVAFGIVGVLLGIAALRADPNQAGGLDTALKTLAALPFGVVLLLLVALGFVAFGVFTLAEARARKV